MVRGRMGPALVVAIHEWYCPACGLRSQTRERRPHTRFHECVKLGGMAAPMLPAGTKAKVEAIEREDYIGDDQVRLDNRGRPIMSIRTTRDDGTDAIVFAPTAMARVR